MGKKVGYVGPRSSYSEWFVRRFDPSAELVPLNGLSQVFRGVANGSVDYGVVPIENSLDGLMGATVDMLFKFKDRVSVIGSGTIGINHALGALKGHSKITRVISRDTAINQCSDYLDLYYPEARRIGSPTSAVGMEMVVRDQLYDAAVISAKESLQNYGLEVIADNIANDSYNVTRFLILGEVGEAEKGKKNSTAIGLRQEKDYPGFLLKVVRIISEKHGLNITSIHSRPLNPELYWIYIEVEGHASDLEVAAALSELGECVPDAELLMFGSFPVSDFTQK